MLFCMTIVNFTPLMQIKIRREGGAFAPAIEPNGWEGGGARRLGDNQAGDLDERGGGGREQGDGGGDEHGAKGDRGAGHWGFSWGGGFDAAYVAAPREMINE